VKFAIIGVDFWRSHKLSVDPAVNRMVETWLLQSFATVTAQTAAVLQLLLMLAGAVLPHHLTMDREAGSN
jgi:hypothetical protein